MRILWSAVSLAVVAVLAFLLWNVASGTERVEVVREGVSVSGTPTPHPSPDTVRRSEAPSSGAPVPGGTTGSDADDLGPSTEGSTAPEPPAPPPPAVPLPDERRDPVAPAPPAQVPLPVHPAPVDDDWDDDWDDD